MGDKIEVAENFGTVPEEEIRVRAGGMKKRRADKQEYVGLRTTPIRPTAKEILEQYHIGDGLNFWERIFVQIIQKILGDKVLILDKSKVLNYQKLQSDLKTLWSKKENQERKGRVKYPVVMELRIPVESKNE